MKWLKALLRFIGLLTDYASAYVVAIVLWLLCLGTRCTGAGLRSGPQVRLHGLMCRCGGDDGFQE